MEYEEEEMKEENVSPESSSPPTPPSPLPISVGPGNQKYSFSLSPTPSPPFSPPPSSNASADNLPLLFETLSTPARTPLAFSLDRKVPDDQVQDNTSCLKDLVEWFVRRCCCCLSWSPQIFDQWQKQD